MSALSEQMTLVKTLARSAARQGDALIAAAIAALDNSVTLPPLPQEIKAPQSVGKQSFEFAPSPVPPPGFPTLTEPTPPPPAQTQDVDAFTRTLDLSPPTLGAVRIASARPGPPPTFPEALSAVDWTATPLESLPLDPPNPPTLLDLTPLGGSWSGVGGEPDPHVHFADPPPPPPDFDENRFDDTVNAVLGELEPGGIGTLHAQTLAAVLPDWIVALRAALHAEIQERTSGLSAAITADLNARLQEAVTQERQRLQAAVREAGTAGGWTLPAAVRAALMQQAQRDGLALEQTAANHRAVQDAELALQQSRLVMDLYTKFRSTVLMLQIQEAQLLNRAFDLARRYATAKTAALIKAFESGQLLKADIGYQIDRVKLQQFEGRLQIALAHQAVAQARIQAEQARQAVNAEQVRQLEAEEAALDLAAETYAGEVAALNQELRRREAQLQGFEAQVRAVAARGDAREARVRALQAEIEGDRARQAAELKKIDFFEAAVRGFAARAQAEKTRIEVNVQRNAQVIEEFKAKVRTALFPVKTSLDKGRFDLKVYQAQADEFVRKIELALKQAEQEIRRLHAVTQLNEGVTETYREAVGEVAAADLERMAAMAAINLDAAKVMEGMAGAAMASLNSVVSNVAVMTE
ncbi:MAG TPA: hypothetical protein PL166_03945 [Candidatus Contendobacter sp.]|nr:hypothetical protein [Candidatus Contendobacter sp.]